MTTFWERAAHWIDHVFSFCFDYLSILVIFRFGFEVAIRVRIAPVSGHCFLVPFSNSVSEITSA